MPNVALETRARERECLRCTKFHFLFITFSRSLARSLGLSLHLNADSKTHAISLHNEHTVCRMQQHTVNQSAGGAWCISEGAWSGGEGERVSQGGNARTENQIKNTFFLSLNSIHCIFAGTICINAYFRQRTIQAKREGMLRTVLCHVYLLPWCIV